MATTEQGIRRRVRPITVVQVEARLFWAFLPRRKKLGSSFKELFVWQKAVELCTNIYRLTSIFPSSEQFGLTNQLRRAAVSIASNIAEGYGRSTRGEYLQFLGHARGSLCELQTQLFISRSLDFASKDAISQAERLSADVSRLLIALMKKLKSVGKAV